MASTIKDVARYTGLSAATISKYINGKKVLEQNEVKIDEAINALDFKVNEFARGLRTSKSSMIGVLIPNLENIFFTGIVSNIESVLMQYGYSTIICDCKQDMKLEESKTEFLLNKMVDGMIVIPLDNSGKNVRKAIDRGIPVVLVDRPMMDLICDTVLVDNLNASYNAVEALITNGHRRIGIISGQPEIYTAQERLRGYIRVCEDYGMELDRELIKYGDYEAESGYCLMMGFLEMENPPTAVFVTNYEMTLGAVMAINDKKVAVPEEVSVIGFDNLQMSRVVSPPLSVVLQPMSQIGDTAANLILKRIRGDYSNFPAMHRLKTEVLIKESVKMLQR